MRALEVNELGPPSNARLVERPAPQPGAGEVVLDVHAAGLNFADTLTISGVYQHKPALPFVPGMEAAGVISACGEGVGGVKVGDRVFCYARQGCFAEQMVMPAAGVFPIPGGMSFVEAAAFPIVYGTAHMGLAYRAALKAGETLLVTGAGGGVGLAAVEIGKALGANVIAAASSKEKLELAKAHGADHIVDYASEHLRDRVMALTGGVDVAFEPVGGDVFRGTLRCMKFEGRLLLIGFASGDIPQIPANHMLVKNVTVIGFAWSNYRDRKPEVFRHTLAEIGRLHATGKLRPEVTEVLPLSQGVEALERLAGRKARGKIVLTMR
ncbi:MAG: NADPH:quinone oxidoreductase family protein [Hyphomicrobiaceae bacterium]